MIWSIKKIVGFAPKTSKLEVNKKNHRFSPEDFEIRKSGHFG